MADPDLTPVIVQDAETEPRADARLRRRRRRFAGRARRARRGSGAARATSSGTRARPRGTRSPWRRSATTATATRSSTACGRTAPPATRAPRVCFAPWLWRIVTSAQTERPDGLVRRLACSTPGQPAAARKVGEEGLEAALAGASESDERLVEELADLWFHSYVLLAARGLEPSAVEDELQRRHASRAGGASE